MPDKRRSKRQLITQSEYARRTGVNRSTISRQVAAGIIPTHGSRRLVDPAEANKARREQTDPSKGKHKPKAPAEKPEKSDKPQESKGRKASPEAVRAQMSFAEARAYGQQLKNEQSEIELRRLREELIERDAVKKVVASMAQAAVGAWLQWPARVYAEMAAELGVDGATLHQVLDRHVRRYADEMSEAPIEFRAPKRKKRVA